MTIEAGELAAELAEGDSVAVNGVCLTATAVAGGTFSADVMAETLRRSSLGPLGAGDRVNLELPLRAADRLGGHIVQGHVDGVGTVAAVAADGFARIVTVAAEPALLRYVVEKGSIAVDGVSLTVAAVDDAEFSVSLIPETLERTTLGGGPARRPREPGGGRAGQVRGEADVAYRGGPMSAQETAFSTIEEAIEDVRDGKMVVVVDAEDRENEGDLTMAAQFATPEAINFMATHGRGLICLALTAERCDELGLDLMAAKNESPFETAFTVSIEAREGVSTGISAHDRARTIQVAIDPAARARDLVQPGHIFPLKAKPGGVLERTGQTEASVDLARLAGLNPSGVICEIMNDDGTMARVPDLERVLRPARAEDDHGRRPDRLPAPPRQADRARGRGRHAHRVRRLQRGRLPLAGRRQAPRRDGQGRGGGQGRRARARALRVPDRRRLPLAALRLRPAARGRAAADRAGGPGRAALPGPGGPRHRPAEQAQGLQAPGGGPRHRGRQPRARPAGRPARLRHRRPDPGGPRARARCGC